MTDAPGGKFSECGVAILYLTASVIFLHKEGNSVVCLENIFYYYQ
jgi:hypothetical protein